MALSYINLFDSIVAYVEASNTARAWVSTCDTIEAAVAAPLYTADELDLLAPISANMASCRDTLTGIASSFANSISGLLLDQSLVLADLNLSARTSRVSDALVALFADMVTQEESLNVSDVVPGSVTPGGVNVGNATLLLDAALDGVTAPLPNGLACLGYATAVDKKLPGVSGYIGRPSELIPAASFTITCTADNQTSGYSVGSETFSIYGGDAPNQPFDWRYTGAGTFNLTMANNSNLLTNGNFETWSTTDTPTGWTLGTGAVATTTIFQEVSSVYRDTYALKIHGTGAATITISQSLVALKPDTRYCVAAYIKGAAGIGAGTLTITPAGTGYIAESTGELIMAYTDLAAQTSYGLEYFFFTTPHVIPADFKLNVSVTSTLTSGQNIYIDDLILVKPTWFAGMAWVMVAGDDNVVIGDTWTVATTGSEGIVQKFFREFYGFQLPSSDSPTVVDPAASY